ncbi:zinc-dependent metalloprotease [Chitinophaga tropicalis]|uniref:DUF5117 domain-containing protein n=1 Tax=Chitinophaga tropicalis TaxID=2683588 RepID=A0A7K1U8N1_9BACT|nr:zinc-dependent metalloprotease [Chitinophaga tropicalis]MVT10345.1 DUF5117 domain-containing protein [Chitinophaga tropicalis]
MKTIQRLMLIAILIAMSPPLQVQGIAKPDSVPLIESYIKPEAERHYGMCNVYIQEGRYLMEVPDSLQGRDILSAITIVQGSAREERPAEKRFGYAGDAVFERIVRFVKEGDRLNLVQPLFMNANDSATWYYRPAGNVLLPVLLSFPVKARGAHSVLIDFTEILTGDGDLFALKGAKEDLGLGSLEADKSSILSIRCFPGNMNFRSLRTYGPGPASATNSEGPKKTTPLSTAWEVGASWILLPVTPMPQRFADERVGYFTKGIKDLDHFPTNPRIVQLATRWDLRPRPEDIQRYQAGELVEPEKPIVFYIDHNTPAYLVSYFMEGVNAWQKAFEKAGFKNAICAKPEPSPEEDSSYSPEDVRYSYISYKASPIPNAYGPQVCDPRSGQIISSRVAVFHNIMDLVQRWYFAMCAATDTAARRYPLSREVMGRLVCNVITHEIGHTLGLRHNFAGSSSYDTDSIRNAAFVEKNGFGASVMDYMRFNYVAQPEDHMPAALLTPGIGVYDLFAIEWGYRYFPQFNSPKSAADSLEHWVTAKRKDVRLHFGKETDHYDPRCQSEDVGNDPVKAGRLGMRNLRLTMKHFEEWAKTSEIDPVHYRQQYRSLLGRYHNYITHALRNIGGRYNNADARPEEGLPAYLPVSHEKQMETMVFLKEYLLTYPGWLFEPSIMEKAAFEFDRDGAEPFSNSLSRLLMMYDQLAANELVTGNNAFTTNDLFNQLYDAIFGKLQNGQPVSEFDRVLQRGLLIKAIAIAESPAAFPNDVAVKLMLMIDKIKMRCEVALPLTADLLTKAHLQSLADMIKIWKTGDAGTLLGRQ